MFCFYSWALPSPSALLSAYFLSSRSEKDGPFLFSRKYYHYPPDSVVSPRQTTHPTNGGPMSQSENHRQFRFLLLLSFLSVAIALPRLPRPQTYDLRRGHKDPAPVPGSGGNFGGRFFFSGTTLLAAIPPPR